MEAQQIEPGVAVAGSRFDRDAPIHQRQPGRVRAVHPTHQRFELTEAIEQLALCFGAHQRLKFMLTVNVEQQLAHGAQHIDRNALAVDPGAAATVGADHPPQQQLAVVRNRLVFKDMSQFAADLSDVYRGAQIGALGTGAHDLGAGAPTAQQLQGIHQHRFARAGFARQHREPARKVDLDGIDDG